MPTPSSPTEECRQESLLVEFVRPDMSMTSVVGEGDAAMMAMGPRSTLRSIWSGAFRIRMSKFVSFLFLSLFEVFLVATHPPEFLGLKRDINAFNVLAMLLKCPLTAASVVGIVKLERSSSRLLVNVIFDRCFPDGYTLK